MLPAVGGSSRANDGQRRQRSAQCGEVRKELEHGEAERERIGGGAYEVAGGYGDETSA